MNTIAIAEIVCAVFVSMLIVAQCLDRDTERSSRIFSIIASTIFVWSVMDILSYCLEASYIPNLFAYTGGSVVACMFMFYCEAYIGERTKLSKWVFAIPKVICLLCAVITFVSFLMGKIVVYENGVVVEEYGIPVIVQIGLGASLLFPPAVAIVKKASAGTKSIFIMGIFGFAPFLTTLAYSWFERDYTIVIDVVSLMTVYIFLQTDRQRNNLREKATNEVLLKNYARFFALEDNFESLYDVNLESGHYEVFVKGEFFKTNVADKLTVPKDYFNELRENIDAVIVEEDRDDLFSKLTRESIRGELKDREHFDHYYRVMNEEGPIWMKMRLVYKDEEKKHVIIGVFNAMEEISSREKEEAHLKATEIQLHHEQLRAEVSKYMVEHDDDPVTLIEKFAGRLRDLIGCDQVIYRDLEETRIMVNSDAIADSWSVPLEYCQQCAHLDAHHEMYKDGFTEMENCQEGWHGIPVYRDCPIKSSLTRLVYCDGEVAGYLAIHYVQDYHHFTDVERTTLEDFTRILTMALSRYSARQKAGELNSVKRTLNMMFSLSDQFDPIIVLDPETGAYDWYQSKAAEIEELTSMSIHGDDLYKSIGIDGSSVIHEDDREQYMAFYTRENMMRIAETGEVQETENRWLVGPDNTYRWKYNKAVRMIDENGKVFVVVGVIDTTESKEEAEKLKKTYAELEDANRRNTLLHQAVRAAIWTYDIDENDNVSAIHFVDRADRDERLNTRERPMSWLDAVHPDDRESVWRLSRAAIADHSGNTPYEVTYRAVLPNGQMMWLKTSGRLIHLDDGTPKLYGISIDITKQIETEREQQRQLEIAREKADAANLAKTNFLFSMSHDIRTPMNAIRGFTTMAKKHIDDKEKVNEYLDKIDISGGQLLTLINQVLEMARIESGKVEFDESRINVRQEFDAIVTVLTEQAEASGLHFTHALKNVEHFNLFADEAKMSSVTLNLAGNAIKYTPEGGNVDFTLTEIPARKPGYATFVFTVSDNGIGMSEEYLKVVYEPFTRENNSTVSKIQGTGLGLSIVKNTVDFLGGNIEVQSSPGNGTRFDVTVDLKIDEAPVEDEENVEIDIFAGRRILLVEDNEMNREIARDMLEDHGFVIEDADDGDVAVEKVQKIVDAGDYGYYDFILMDVQMPRVSGYEATKLIRKMAWPEGKYVPIIALTANAFEEDRQNAIDAGMDEHLAKPVDIQKLFRILAKFL